MGVCPSSSASSSSAKSASAPGHMRTRLLPWPAGRRAAQFSTAQPSKIHKGTELEALQGPEGAGRTWRGGLQGGRVEVQLLQVPLPPGTLCFTARSSAWYGAAATARRQAVPAILIKAALQRSPHLLAALARELGGHQCHQSPFCCTCVHLCERCASAAVLGI